METDETRRTAAVCADCGRVVAATVAPDGSIRSIGQPDGCDCGGTDFVPPDRDA